MSLYSEDPEFKKAFDAYAKEVFEFIKKHLEDYIGKYISTWVDKEIKKMITQGEIIIPKINGNEEGNE